MSDNEDKDEDVEKIKKKKKHKIFSISDENTFKIMALFL